MSRRWRQMRLPATVALALMASHDATPVPVEERREKMPERPVSEVQPTSENPPDVTLTCSVDRTEQGIHVHYFLSNQSSGTILIFERVRFNAMNTLTLPVDVVCDAGAGSVNFVLGLSPDPLFSTKRTTQPHSWYQDKTAVRPSTNVAATIDLALPLLEWDMWNASTAWSKVAKADQAVVVHTARLVVDFVRRARKDFKPDFPARSAESVWCTAPLDPPVTLLRHPGFGEYGDPARLRAFNLGPDRVHSREAALAGLRAQTAAEQEQRAHYTTPRRRGTSPVDMPKTWQDRYF